MKNSEETKALLAYFQREENKPIKFDEEAINLAYQKERDSSSLAVKILSILGGLLASFSFLGFLALMEINNSSLALLLFGGVFIIGSLWVYHQYDEIVIDTVSISFFIAGLMLIGLALMQLDTSESIISLVFTAIALVALGLNKGYALDFISVLIVHGSILMLIISNQVYVFIHVYTSGLAFAMAYFYLKEAKIIATRKMLSQLYNPVKTALVFSFLSVMILLVEKGLLLPSIDHIWLSSIVIIAVIICLVFNLFGVFGVTKTAYKIGGAVFAVLTLLPTVSFPAISGAILIILLSFMTNHKYSLALGVIAFIYFVFQYYYDLNFTLLVKSVLLFSTGVFFIAFYFFTFQKRTKNEEI